MQHLADLLWAPPTFLVGEPEGPPGQRAERQVSFVVGQNMFTPDDKAARALVRDDRPYAGWLYAGVALHRIGRDVLDTAELDLGVVGPSSRAEQTQTLWHRQVNVGPAEGWDHQLHDEPAALLTFERRRRYDEALSAVGPVKLDFIATYGAAVGNVYTLADLGGMIRFSNALPLDFGPPRIKPALSGADYTPGLGGPGVGVARAAWYGFLGADVRAVARDIFLDGNTFRDSHHVTRKPVVGELQAGAAFFFGAARISYMFVYRSREYEEQHGPDRFAGLSLTLRL